MNELFKVQKQCIRIITGKGNSDTIDEDFKSLKIVHISDMIRIELAKFGYEISQKSVPKSLLNMLNSNGGLKKHRYPTRGKNVPNIQAHTSETLNKSFMWKSLAIYNKLGSSMKNSKKSKILSGRLKREILQT